MLGAFANAFRTPWPQPFPALPGYSIRDYGNRVGHMRQMKVLDKYGVRGSISLSSALIDHHPETGVKDARLLKALVGQRPVNRAGEPMFGVYAECVRPGVVDI